MKVAEAMADAIRIEATSTLFALMGDGNMDFMAAIDTRGAARLLHARHEGAAPAMADGYSHVSGEVGVATVTCGPGVTQLATLLMVASRHRSPLVIIAGDTETAMKGVGALQDMDQRAFAEASGAIFQQLRGPSTVAADMQQAFLSGSDPAATCLL